jgi:hypothetical protein
MLSNSDYYVQTRKQYAQLLNELGGFGYAVELYNNSGTNLFYIKKMVLISFRKILSI